MQYMAVLRDGDIYDVIVPRVKDYPQGLHAIYNKNCLEPIRKLLEKDKLKVIGFYSDMRVRYLDIAEYGKFDPKKLAFMNVNTPEDLQAARKLAQED
jgi:molybdopterin-guanine dinucleotide biosynthesis protein A